MDESNAEWGWGGSETGAAQPSPPDGFFGPGFPGALPGPACGFGADAPGVPASLAPSLAGSFPPSFFFGDPYKSAYQPPPLSWKAVRETSLASRLLPHSGQAAGGRSVIFCITSVSRPHRSQRYS